MKVQIIGNELVFTEKENKADINALFARLDGDSESALQAIEAAVESANIPRDQTESGVPSSTSQSAPSTSPSTSQPALDAALSDYFGGKE